MELSDPAQKKQNSGVYQTETKTGLPTKFYICNHYYVSFYASGFISRFELWFVRCIKPNTSKTPMRFDADVVAHQINSTGMLAMTRIRGQGYPHHMTPEDFLTR